MKRKLWIAVGVPMLAIFASALFGRSASADGESEDDLNLWQLMAERMGDPEYYDSEVDGAWELEDWALLYELVASELGISVDATSGSGGGPAPLTGACSTDGTTITCAATTPTNPYVRVGRKAGRDYIIMCQSTDNVNYTQTGSQLRTTETYLHVIGTLGQDIITLMKAATGSGDCSFQSFPSDWFTSQILVNGMDAYDWIYGSYYDDTLYGEYVRGYGGDDYIYIGANESGTEYAWGGNDNDHIYGVAGSQYLYGESGADYIAGYRGDDFLSGGSGNDDLYGDTLPSKTPSRGRLTERNA